MWQGYLDSNQGMAASKAAALPLGDSPKAAALPLGDSPTGLFKVSITLKDGAEGET